MPLEPDSLASFSLPKKAEQVYPAIENYAATWRTRWTQWTGKPVFFRLAAWNNWKGIAF